MAVKSRLEQQADADSDKLRAAPAATAFLLLLRINQPSPSNALQRDQPLKCAQSLLSESKREKAIGIAERATNNKESDTYQVIRMAMYALYRNTTPSDLVSQYKAK